MLDVLCEIAQCPVSGRRLVPADAGALAALNRRVDEADLRHLDGTPVVRPLDDALMVEESALVYRVDDGIGALLPELAITLDDTSGLPQPDRAKHIVRDFYDEFGWKKQGDLYLDTLTFVDLRPISLDYLARCHRRIRRHLPRTGRFIVDAASGPVQYEEYRRLSEGFEFRVCVDFSLRALQEARRNVGDHGLYLLGDVTRLPLRTNSMDAALSLHTIYHVPAAEQAAAFTELHRVVRPGGTAIVVYEWAPRRGVRAAVGKAARLAGLRRAATPARAGVPELYAHKHSYRWFRAQQWPFQPDVRVWRSVRGSFIRRFVHERFLGRALLGLLYRLEERAPKLAGRFGSFPLIVIRKAT